MRCSIGVLVPYIVVPLMVAHKSTSILNLHYGL